MQALFLLRLNVPKTAFYSSYVPLYARFVTFAQTTKTVLLLKMFISGVNSVQCIQITYPGK